MESCGLRLRRHFDDEWSTRIVRMKGYQYKQKCRRRRRSGGRSVQLVLLDSPQQQEPDEASSRYSSQVDAAVCLLLHYHFVDTFSTWLRTSECHGVCTLLVSHDIKALCVCIVPMSGACAGQQLCSTALLLTSTYRRHPVARKSEHFVVVRAE